MNHRLLSFGGAVLVLVAVFSTTRLAGQSSPTAATARSPEATRWTSPRTPWGDPDLSGIYSNSDESGIPFERPARFEGRRNEDLRPRNWKRTVSPREPRHAAEAGADRRTLRRIAVSTTDASRGAYQAR